MTSQRKKQEGGTKGEAAALLDRRAHWVMELESDHPSLSYYEKVQRVRAHFEVGKSAAENALARANVLRREMWDPVKNPAITDLITQGYWEMYEMAKAQDDPRVARSVLDSMRRHLGVGAADRVDVTTHDENDFEDLTEEQLKALAAADTKKPGRETP